jgi:hypothetical protein
MRFIMMAVMFVLTGALLASPGFSATTYVRVKPASASQQPHYKKPVKK